MELRPFRALRYDTSRVNLADVVAPPYDVIDEGHRDRLYARSPYNVIRLILNRDANRYASAAQHLTEWIDAGLLYQDAAPALWLYVQNFTRDARQYERIGVIGGVRLEPFSSGHIRPHERTLSAPKEDRMRLLEACRVNLSPIFGLYADQIQVLTQARAAAERHDPAMDVTDEFTVRHRMWCLSDPAVIGRITSALARETIFIADGHHRYETAMEYRDRLRAQGLRDADDPANFIMMFLCSMEDPGLLVLPTHRILCGLTGFDPAAFLAALRRVFRLHSFPSSPAGQSQLLAHLTAGAGHKRFGIALRGDDALYAISLLDESELERHAAELPAVVRQLAVTILDRLILRGILGIDPDAAARAGHLRYHHEVAGAFASVESGVAQIAFVLGPPDIAEVQAVCLSGETMPQKSTYFYPKLLSGLLFNRLTSDRGGRLPAAGMARAG